MAIFETKCLLQKIFKIYFKLSLSLVYIAYFKVPCSSLGVFESLKEGECSQTWSIAPNSIVVALSNSLNVLYTDSCNHVLLSHLLETFEEKQHDFLLALHKMPGRVSHCLQSPCIGGDSTVAS